MARVEQNLAMLEHAATELERVLPRLRDAAVSDSTRVRELCLGAAAVTARRLRAIRLLASEGFAAEAQALARGLVEAAINLGWVNDSEERATRIQLRGPVAMQRLLEEAAQIGFTVDSNTFESVQNAIDEISDGRDLKGLPRISQRAADAGQLFSFDQAEQLYRWAFVRQSSAVHLDWTHICQACEERELLEPLLHEVIAAALFITLPLAQAFDEPEELLVLCDELQHTLHNNAVAE